MKNLSILGSVKLRNFSFAYCSKLKDVYVAKDFISVAGTPFGGDVSVNRTLVFCGTNNTDVDLKDISEVHVGLDYKEKVFGGIEVIVDEKTCNYHEPEKHQKNYYLLIICCSAGGFVLIVFIIIGIIYVRYKNSNVKREYLSESLLVKV